MGFYVNVILMREFYNWKANQQIYDMGTDTQINAPLAPLSRQFGAMFKPVWRHVGQTGAKVAPKPQSFIVLRIYTSYALWSYDIVGTTW